MMVGLTAFPPPMTSTVTTGAAKATAAATAKVVNFIKRYLSSPAAEDQPSCDGRGGASCYPVPSMCFFEPKMANARVEADALHVYFRAGLPRRLPGRAAAGRRRCSKGRAQGDDVAVVSG
jgi:hypothetical protein